MKQTNFQYPTFTNGGILSKEILDNLAGYGDEQSRLTRARLIGCGIVNGLEYRFEKSNPCMLTLFPGTAISADGNLICIDAETTYYLLKAKSPKNELEQYVLSEEPTKKDFTSVKAIPSGYVLALRYAKIPATQENCSQLSCDLVNVRTYVRCVPILHPSSMTDKSSYFPQLISGYVEIEKWNDICSCLNTGMLHKRIRKLFNSGCTNLLEKVGEITSWFNFDEGLAFACRFDDAEARRNQLQNAYTRIEKLCIRSGIGYETTEIPPYYLEFLEDMKDAVNEFIDAFNGLVSKYTRIPAGGKIDDSTVTLGVVSEGQSDLSHDMYRSFFEYVNRGDSFDQDCRIVWQLLRRFCTMAEQFSATSYQWKDKPLKIIPVNPAAPLSDRHIPFYYNTVGTDLRKVWRAQSIDLHMTDKCYDSFTEQGHFILDRSISGYSIQGYYNQPKDDILSELNSLISLNNLPIRCQEIKIDDYSINTNTLDVIKNKLINPLNDIAKDTKDVKELESFVRTSMADSSFNSAMDIINGTSGKKELLIGDQIALIFAILTLSGLTLLRFIKNIDDLKRCYTSIRNGDLPDFISLKKVHSLFEDHASDLGQLIDGVSSTLEIKNLSKDKIINYYSAQMVFSAINLREKSVKVDAVAVTEEEIKKQLNQDYLRAFCDFKKYVYSIFRPEFIYAKDRYAGKSDTIYVAHHRGKVIYCFYDQK